MRVPIPLCRAGYRCAYQGLRAYWFLRRPDIRGVKCVLTDGDRVLLVRHTYGNRAWDLPGGAVRRDEAPHDAARREMHEELGVRVEHFNHLGQIRARVDFRRDTMQLYHAELDDPAISMDPCELLAVDWFDLEGLPGDLGRFVTRILAVLPA